MVHPLIEAGQLQDHLEDSALRVVDVRFNLGDPGEGRRAYEAGHIPGAVYLDLEHDLSGPVIGPGGRHPLPDPGMLAHRLGALGIGSESRVVAYDAQNSEFAGRLWWLLRYLGHDNVQILDGGLRAWGQIGGPLTAEIPVRAPARFEPHPRPELVVAAHEDVERAARARELVDSRAGPRYRGEVEPLDRRAGHIPGALHYDFTRTLSADGRFRPVPELKERFGGLASSPVVYCGSGVTATVNVVAMTIAGLAPRLYAGSFSDWVDSDERPVATGPEHVDPEEGAGQA